MVNFPRLTIKFQHIDQMFLIIRLLCLAMMVLAALYLLVVVFFSEYMELQGNALALQALTSQTSQDEPYVPKDDHGESNKIAERFLASSKLFGELSPPDLVATPQVSPTPQKANDDTLSLIGTFVSLSNNSYAIVENKKKRTQDVFGIGESIFGLATLRSIDTLSVTISRNGKDEKLVMEEGEPGAPSPYSENSSSETKVVENSDVEEALNNLPVLLTQARTVPYFSNGKRDGLRLFAIRSGSFFEKIGLQNGDILKEINGNDLNDQSKALELFQRLKSERRLSVKLVRNRQEKLINYEIR